MPATGPAHPLFAALRRVARAVEEQSRREIEGLGLCPSDFGILAALADGGPLPLHSLGRHVHLTSGAMTTAIDRLAERGLVRRKTSDLDRRSRTVHLTAEGRVMWRRADREHARAMTEFIRALNASEQKEALRLLVKLGGGLAVGAPPATERA